MNGILIWLKRHIILIAILCSLGLIAITISYYPGVSPSLSILSLILSVFFFISRRKFHYIPTIYILLLLWVVSIFALGSSEMNSLRNEIYLQKLTFGHFGEYGKRRQQVFKVLYSIIPIIISSIIFILFLIASLKHKDRRFE